MKRFLHLMGVLCLSILLIANSGCFIDNLVCQDASGDVVTDTFDLDSLHSIDLAIDADVIIVQGPKQYVSVKGREDAMNILNKDVVDGEWRIDYDGSECFRNADLEIKITVPSISMLSLSGSGTIISDDIFTQFEDVNLDISGSGLIKVGIDATNIDSRISGSGNMTVWGNATKNTVKISGSGRFNGYDLIAVNADITISGSGDAEVYVDGGVLDAKVTGSGDINYKGTPSSVNLKVTGSGRVTDRN